MVDYSWIGHVTLDIAKKLISPFRFCQAFKVLKQHTLNAYQYIFPIEDG
jgi:hypothetical protein